MNEVLVSGRIDFIRNLGGIVFFSLRNQEKHITVSVSRDVLEGARLRVGDHVRVRGSEANSSDFCRELVADDIHIVGSSNLRINQTCITPEKMDRIQLRSQALREINSFMDEHNILPVQSPTVVGDWVEGKTATFSVNYFGKEKHLTLNNMLYHQILLLSGYSRIYEISKIFRASSGRTHNSLTELASLDISEAYIDSEHMQSLVEELIRSLHSALSRFKQPTCGLRFDRFTYADLKKLSGNDAECGAQLSAIEKKYLNMHCSGYVWITNFPESKRRFFVKSEDGICQDYQLWYQGQAQFASGSARETDLERMRDKILAEGKRLEIYEAFLGYFKNGVPPMCEIGFGIDRFMMYTFGGQIADYLAFPRIGKSFAL